MKALIALVLCALVSGCATSAKLERKLDSWVGTPAEELIEAWGYPSRQFKKPNGDMVYIYDQKSYNTTPVITTSRVSNSGYINSYSSGGNVIESACEIVFEMDPFDRISTWSYRGNHCVSG